MLLPVVFVSANAAVLDTVAERRDALIPSEIRARRFEALGGEEIVISAYRVSESSNLNGLLAHIGKISDRKLSGVILLIDGSMPNVIDSVGDIFSVNTFEVPPYGQKMGNFLSSTISRALRAFRHYKTRFDDAKYQQILRLPLRNFAASEIAALRETCHDMMNCGNFGRDLDGLMHKFRAKRQHPKKASSYPDTYLVDDDGKHFSLGHEVHAQADTAMPPHNALCALANNFRFGRVFDGTRHFNVSRDGSGLMAGQYSDCHNEQRPGGGGKHLNMFTSDFF